LPPSPERLLSTTAAVAAEHGGCWGGGSDGIGQQPVVVQLLGSRPALMGLLRTLEGRCKGVERPYLVHCSGESVPLRWRYLALKM